jgi:hypothetical protein
VLIFFWLKVAKLTIHDQNFFTRIPFSVDFFTLKITKFYNSRKNVFFLIPKKLHRSWAGAPLKFKSKGSAEVLLTTHNPAAQDAEGVA